jgi:hypothetical protein
MSLALGSAAFCAARARSDTGQRRTRFLAGLPATA